MALILEIRDARGAVSWHRLDTLPLTLGRGLSNDIILDDPYLDARHARITLGSDGAVAIDDLGSVNGLHQSGERAAGMVTVSAGTAVRIGRTTLRFRHADEVVAPALVDVGALASTRARALACALMIAGVACNAWLGDTDRSSGSTILGASLGVVALIAVWSGLWGIGGRASVRRFDFLGHAAIASAGLVALLAWGAVNDWLTFLFPDAGAVRVLSLAVFLAVLAALVANHLSLASGLTRRRQRRTGLITAGAVVVLIAVAALVADDRFTDVPRFAHELKPLSVRLVPTRSVGEFEGVMGELREEVDERAVNGLR